MTLKMASAHHLGIIKISNFYWLKEPIWSRCITMPNFIKTGSSTAEILQFFDFSIWRPSAILDLFGAYLDIYKEYFVVFITVQY